MAKGGFALLKEILKRPVSTETHFRYRDIRFFFQFVKPEWKTGATGFFLTIIITALSSVLPLSSKVVIDFVIMKKGFERVEDLLNYLHLGSFTSGTRHFLESLPLVVSAVLAIGILIGLLGILQRYLLFRFQQELTFNLQTTLFDRLLRFPLSFFKEKQTGYLMSRVSDDVEAMQYLFSDSIMEMVTKMCYFSFGLVVLFGLNTKLTLILLTVMPAYVFINVYFAERLRGTSQSEREAGAQVTRNLQEVISGVEVIKSYTTEEREVKKISGKIRTAIQTRIKSMLLSLFSQYAARGVQLLITLLIMWFGAREILNNAMTIGDYVAFTSYVVYLSGSINTLSMFHVMLQPLFASMDRLMELFKIVPEMRHKEKEDLKRLDSVKGEVIFDKVSFSYDNKRDVLKNISFTAHPGETIALVGESGVGKTTLMNLLLKFYMPQSGTIRLDGCEISDLDSGWFRQLFGVVSQDIFLFDDTVEHNIRYGNISATKEEVIEAARKAHIHEVIEQFPEKYDTLIGERGTRLSAGQCQRISIARAFLKNPFILIFDEPTSALDEETERLLKEAMGDVFRGRTAFIISHRNSMLDVADRTFVLSGERLEELKR